MLGATSQLDARGEAEKDAEGSGIQSLPTIYTSMPNTQGIHAMIRWPDRSSDWWFVDDKMQTFLWSVCLSMIEPFFFQPIFKREVLLLLQV